MSSMERIADNPSVKAWHRILTLVDIPMLLGISVFGGISFGR